MRVNKNDLTLCKYVCDTLAKRKHTSTRQQTVITNAEHLISLLPRKHVFSQQSTKFNSF